MGGHSILLYISYLRLDPISDFSVLYNYEIYGSSSLEVFRM